jgi:hypothetical protein
MKRGNGLQDSVRTKIRRYKLPFSVCRSVIPPWFYSPSTKLLITIQFQHIIPLIIQPAALDTMLQPRFSGPTLRFVAVTKKGFSSSLNTFEIRRSSTTALPRGKSTGIIDNAASTASQQRLAEHPLSVMPTKMLLRSLFIATVSSNKFLLLPSLQLLSFFSKPNRNFLFNVDRNPVLKAILKRTLYNQFCAGETELETRACVQQLKDLGFKGVILTYAKEMVFDNKSKSANHHSSTSEKYHEMQAAVSNDTDIEAWRVGTLKTADLISEGDILAIK